MKATLEGHVLHLDIPIAPYRNEKGTLMVFSTHGWQKTEAMYNGAPIAISLNACARGDWRRGKRRQTGIFQEDIEEIENFDGEDGL